MSQIEPTCEQLIRVIRRLIDANDLHRTNREDTIGVLMRCGAFNEAISMSQDKFVVSVASLIDSVENTEPPA